MLQLYLYLSEDWLDSNDKYWEELIDDTPAEWTGDSITVAIEDEEEWTALVEDMLENLTADEDENLWQAVAVAKVKGYMAGEAIGRIAEELEAGSMHDRAEDPIIVLMKDVTKEMLADEGENEDEDENDSPGL